MLTISGLSKSYAGRVLFERVSLQVNRGDRIGLVGANGTGKSTIFDILVGEESPDSGQVTFQRGTTLGFLPQESAPAGSESVLETATMHLPEDARWEAEPRAKSILRGLAFREIDFSRPLREMSGGWVMRAHIARLLVQRPDLLLLDEPTNHLDLESLIWLREHLKTYPGAILMISHDRDFLNQLVRSIAELAFRSLHLYPGNYDAYELERERRAAHQAAVHQNQAREIERLQTFVDRFRAKNTKAAQAQSKLKQIDRIKDSMVEAPQRRGKTVSFRFPQPARSGQRVIALRGVHFAYGPKPVYRGLDLEIERGQRIVLVGPNGAGKSTLLKLLAGVLVPQSGERTLGHSVFPGYFAQNRTENLAPAHTVLQEAMSVRTRPPEPFVRTVLGAFLFSGNEAVEKPVAVLSGGEKTRLALAKLLLDPPNLLLMDEPTTHLDMPSIEALIAALEQYEGTLAFISHDVHFIRRVATKVLHISAGRITAYAGDYDYFLLRTGATDARRAAEAGEALSDCRAGVAADAAAPKGEKIFLTREEKRAMHAARETVLAAKRAAKKRVEDIERSIAAMEIRQAELAAELEKPETYEDRARPLEINRELAGVSDSLQRLAAEWENAAAEAEALG